MQNLIATEAPSESEFADLVDELAADPNQCEQLIHLLREDHPFYNQRGAATVVRMRGWVLLAIARNGVSDDTLLFVLEELDTGVDPYLVAAAACALRSYPNPTSALAPFVMRALAQIRYHDEPVSFQAYGDYAVGSTGTSPVRELLVTLTWLGQHASGVLPEIEAVVQSGGLAKKVLSEADRALEAIRGADQILQADADTCCTLPAGLISQFSWSRNSRRDSEPIESTVFEDQAGELITFKGFFRGHPSIVVFFYTRCDNPLKCSLTVTKLARVQKLLELHGLSGQIHTAAITYDPAFDLSERIRGYGQNRSVRFDAGHRMLRPTGGIDALRRHFKLGVNFIESLVNRHRIEAYVLDTEGRIAASFERLHWDEQEVVDRALEVLTERNGGQASINPPAPEPPAPNLSAPNSSSPERRVLPSTAAPVWGTLASLGVAFFPKCPVCWAAYLSVLGIVGLNQIPYSPWLQPVLAVVMLINVVSVWLRGRLTGQMSGAYLVTTGALAIVISKMGLGWESAAVGGVVLTLAGSLLSAASSMTNRKRSRSLLNQT
ncbi:MAG: SCO family protein [Pyrinomonadaceae bacterium]